MMGRLLDGMRVVSAMSAWSVGSAAFRRSGRTRKKQYVKFQRGTSCLNLVPSSGGFKTRVDRWSRLAPRGFNRAGNLFVFSPILRTVPVTARLISLAKSQRKTAAPTTEKRTVAKRVSDLEADLAKLYAEIGWLKAHVAPRSWSHPDAPMPLMPPGYVPAKYEYSFMALCGCPVGTVCGNAACPHLAKITC